MCRTANHYFKEIEMENKITVTGIGSIIVDVAAGTMQPTTHVVAQRLGVGYGFDDARKASVARERREDIVAQATKEHGLPEFGWRWLDHNGGDAGAA
jgi:hypothetical protein